MTSENGNLAKIRDLGDILNYGLTFYEQALEECDEKISKWETFKNEYLGLQERLHSLPLKVSHDVMVPIGKVALLPGHLMHTNEVLVLLGDNWFATRSASQASQIVERRLEYVHDMLKKLHEERNLLRDRLHFSSSIKGDIDAEDEIVEIREPLPEGTVSRRKLRQFDSDGRLLADADAARKQKVTSNDFATVMSRLDQLEMEEATGDKDNEQPGCSSVAEKIVVDRPKRKITWQDSTDDRDISAVKDSITSHVPKSILKNRDEISPTNPLPPCPYDQTTKTVVPGSTEAFSGVVVERSVTEHSMAGMHPELRRQSKFARERTKKPS